MELCEKIRFMRMFKGWSQEEMAEKLGMVVSGYAKIERGETDVNFSRLTQIANLFGIELSNLIGLNEKNVFNVVENSNYYSPLSNVTVSIPESEFKIQLEKFQIIVEQQNKEIAYLKEIIELMKK
jgi:transcriptional regulator with XRE-family HTH domain